MKHFNHMLALLLAAALTTASVSISAFAEAEAWGDVAKDNFVRISSAAAFRGGSLENLSVDETVGDGALRLDSRAAEGSYTSPEIDVPAFEYLVASWGADTPEGAGVEIRVRAYVPQCDGWSGWMSWGKWGTTIRRGCTEDSDSLAYMDTDTLTIRGNNGETAQRVQIMAVLTRAAGGEAPVLRQVCVTMKNTLTEQAIPVYHPDETAVLPESVLLATPAYSQMVRDGSIADSICSPTTMTMLLNDRGQDLFPEEVALGGYDMNYQGFGNWSYTVAEAGAYGYSAYCHYADLDFLRQELAMGRSVGISVRYSNIPGNVNPYLENGAASNTNGHLIAIVGYGTEDGADYFYSNDSAAGSDTGAALRRYWADQLDAAWISRIAYVVDAQPETGGGTAAPQRVQATLEPTTTEHVYTLKVNGEPITLSENFGAKTRAMGAGTAFLLTDNARQANLPDTVTATVANRALDYSSVSVNAEGKVRINTENAVDTGAASAQAYLILNNGVTYVAQLQLDSKVQPVMGALRLTGASTVMIVVAAVLAVLVAVAACIRRKRR